MNKILELIKEKSNKKYKWQDGKKISRLKNMFADFSGQSEFQTKILIYAVSLIISLLIWMFVAWDGNTEGTRSITLQIRYSNMPRGYSIFSKTKTVQVRLAGRINALSRVRPEDVTAQVDLQGLGIGRYNLPIKIDVPNYVRIRSWDPPTAEVEVYRHIERTVPVAWKIDGSLPEGTVVASVDIKPQEAIVAGPEIDVLSIQSVNAVLPADKLSKSQEISVPLAITGLDRDRLDRITIAPQYVNVTVSLEKEIKAASIPVKVSVTGQPADGYEVDSISVIPDRVLVSGRGAAIQKLQSVVLPPVDITGLDQDLELMIPIRPVEMESDVEIAGPERAKVEIKIRKKITAKNYQNVGVMIEGSPPGKEWKITPDVVNIVIEGTQLALDSLGDDIPCELYVDVSNIVSRKVELPVLVKGLRKEFKVLKIEPEQVVVTALN